MLQKTVCVNDFWVVSYILHLLLIWCLALQSNLTELCVLVIAYYASINARHAPAIIWNLIYSCSVLIEQHKNMYFNNFRSTNACYNCMKNDKCGGFFGAFCNIHSGSKMFLNYNWRLNQNRKLTMPYWAWSIFCYM